MDDLSRPARRQLQNLMEYLERHERGTEEVVDNTGISDETYIAYSEARAKLVTLKLELEEANKTISALKWALDKQRKEGQQREVEIGDKFQKELEKQKGEYEAGLEKQIRFIEELVQEKEERLRLIAELHQRLRDMEGSYQKQIQNLSKQHKVEMKKLKDNLQTADKVKRERWMKDKYQEIKEMTARGLEPEINKLLAVRCMQEHKKMIADMKEEHQEELRKLRTVLENQAAGQLVSINLGK